MKTFNFSNIEKEAVLLAATFELINGAVNYQVLEIGGRSQTQVGFKSSTHFYYFSIMLVDFISKPDSSVFGLNDSYLGCLKVIADSPTLGPDIAVKDLKDSVSSFFNWLEGKALYKKAWFPSIELEADILVRRGDIINICGNIAKHNFTRLTGIAKLLRRVFSENGHSLDLHQSLSIIDEFQNQFHNNVLSYHTTTIAAFLNDVRWGVFEYLQPTYQESLVRLGGDPSTYRYNYPSGLENEFARECFWNLMNKIRSKPWVPRFSAPDYLRAQY